VIIAGVVELAVAELEVDDLVMGVMDENYLREVEVMDKDYQMKVVVVRDGCLMDDPLASVCTIR